jgi:hypothetical protein
MGSTCRGAALLTRVHGNHPQDHDELKYIIQFIGLGVAAQRIVETKNYGTAPLERTHFNGLSSD